MVHVFMWYIVINMKLEDTFYDKDAPLLLRMHILFHSLLYLYLSFKINLMISFRMQINKKRQLQELIIMASVWIDCLRFHWISMLMLFTIKFFSIKMCIAWVKSKRFVHIFIDRQQKCPSKVSLSFNMDTFFNHKSWSMEFMWCQRRKHW
jgi:hypothetical protein